MKIVKITGIVIIALLLASCNPSKEKMAKDIATKEKGLFVDGSPVPDKTKIKEVIDLYKKYVQTFPKDSMAPKYLFKGSDLSMNTGQSPEAIIFLDQIISDYPDFKKLPEAYFLKAFIYDDKIKNLPKARAAYMEFIQKFPKHDLVNDAKISMDNLGKTPEQIVKEFEIKVKQKSDSAEAAAKKK